MEHAKISKVPNEQYILNMYSHGAPGKFGGDSAGRIFHIINKLLSVL